MSRRRAARTWETKSGANRSVTNGPCKDDPVELLLARSRRLRLKGDDRKALVLLRQACNLDEWRARSWTLLGAHLSTLGRREEAFRAFQQARWLRLRAGETTRAAITERLAAEVAPAAA